MTLHKYILTTLAGFSMLASSCSDCTEGSGNVTSIDRPLSAFSRIRLEGSSHAYIIKDSVFFVRISADDNVIPLIETSVSNGKLVVGKMDNKCIKNEHRTDIYIHTNNIQEVIMEGSGSVDGQSGFAGDELSVTIKGSGDLRMNYVGNKVRGAIEGSGNIHLAGAAATQEFAITGSGYIHADQMPASNVKVSIQGSGNMDVNSTGYLDVNISGSGTVWYSGNPSIQTDISGSGKVKKK